MYINNITLNNPIMPVESTEITKFNIVSYHNPNRKGLFEWVIKTAYSHKTLLFLLFK